VSSNPDATPGRFEPGGTRSHFDPPAVLANAHAQSILASLPLRKRVVRRRACALRALSTPQILTSPAGVRLLGYHTPAPEPAQGLVVLLHGWEGSADSHYLLSVADTLHRAGFEIFRLNFRDHGDTHALNEDLFHSCRIDEVVDAIRLIQDRYLGRPTFLVGYSLGGNFALRTALRAQGGGLVLAKVVAICPVLDPHSTMEALENGLWIYRHYFLRKWRRSLLAKEACFPHRYELGDLRRFPTLTDTTEYFVENHTEFPDLHTYLSGYAIVGPVLENLSIPTRLIAAGDDPIVPSDDLARVRGSEYLEITVLPRGGHCGFLSNYRLRSWLDQEILQELISAA